MTRAAQTATQETPAAPEPPPLLRVLMVEDDNDDAVLIADMLTEDELGAVFRLRRVAGLREGLDAVDEGAPDVLLLDLSLPDSHGLDTFRAFRARFPDVPAVVLSGLADSAVAARAVQEGAQDYLVKGRIDGGMLARSIRYAMERQRLVKALSEKNDALAAGARRLRRIIDSNADGIFLIDPAGFILFANPACEALYGVPAAALVGQRFGLPHVGAAQAEIGILNAGGRSIVAEMRVTETQWDGRPCYLASLRDVTRRVAAEDALRLYRDRLEEIVTRRTNELSQINARLEQEIAGHERTERALREALARVEAHNRAKSEFVSNVSHELKTPLASMSYAVENLLKGVLGEVSTPVRDYLAMLRDDARRLAATVNDILDLSRIEAHALSMHRVTLPVRRLVEQAVESLRPQALRKRQTLAVNVNGAALFVRGDPARLDRVLINIVGNAIKYTGEGGSIEVTASLAESPAAAVRMVVLDNGVGIPPEHLPHVAERYYRVGEHVSGTGLGLAISREVIELHGGGLRVESPPPGRRQGTAVTIELPRADPPAVLVVDDNADVRELVCRQLGRHGYRVTACASAREAMRAIEASAPEILLVDLVLPDDDGIEVIGRVRAAPERRGLPIVVITGATVDNAKRQILEEFGVPVVCKPWRADELLAVVEDSALNRQYFQT